MEVIHEALNTAYILYSFFLGLYAATIAGRDIPISGEFWGAMWTNTALAAMILVVSIILTIQGLRPVGLDPDNPPQTIERNVYYLYLIYFMISLPGIYTITRGNDNRTTALFYGGVSLFNSAAAFSASQRLFSTWG